MKLVQRSYLEEGGACIVHGEQRVDAVDIVDVIVR